MPSMINLSKIADRNSGMLYLLFFLFLVKARSFIEMIRYLCYLFIIFVRVGDFILLCIYWLLHIEL